MVHRTWPPALAAVLLSLSCGGGLSQAPPAAVPPVAQRQPAPLTSPPASTSDPIEALVARSQAHFDTGQAELQVGHLERAKAEFNAALDVLLESPFGARSNARLREHFDRLVDRISSYEIRALAEGDGFSEQWTEPASIDQLLDMSTFALPPPPPDLGETVASDLKATTHDIPIPPNGKVLAYIDLFKGRLRDWFQAAMQRGLPYLPMIQSVFKAEGLPLDLAYVPLVESAFKTNALSRAKAKGFWQFVAATGKEHGLRYDWYVDERSDPEKATVAAAKYLEKLHDMFDGDWHLALASYNSGPGYVLRAMKRKGADDFWEIVEQGTYLPRETREYVPMVLAAIVIGRNPAQYGFTFEPVGPAEYDRVALPGPVDLRRVAEWAGTTLDRIQTLNPELRRWTTPLRAKGYTLKVPKGTAERLHERLSEAAPEDLTALQWHTVKRGESLSTIANKLRVRRNDLAEANYLSLRSKVSPGQKLVIPRAPTTLLAARAERSTPVTESRAIDAPGASATPAVPMASNRVRTTYLVKKGDTLHGIALAFRTTVDAIKSINRLRGSLITPGDRLTVFAERRAGGVHY